MRWIGLLILLLTGQVLCAGALDDRLTLEVRADYALHFEGFTKVREHDQPGEHLDLGNDLGVRRWFSFGFESSWRFDGHNAIRSTFTWNQFRGGKTFDHDVWHDGALFAAGTRIDFAPTRWWRAELYYEFTPWRSDWGGLALLAGVSIDDLNVFLKPNKLRLSTKQEYHEDFGAQRTPLPAFGARLTLTPADGLRVEFEARGTYMRNLATWYFEGGRIYHSQTNLDAGIAISYRVREVSFGAALKYRVFRIEDTSREDGNEFAIHGTQAELFIRVTL